MFVEQACSNSSKQVVDRLKDAAILVLTYAFHYSLSTVPDELASVDDSLLRMLGLYVQWFIIPPMIV